LPVVPRVGRDLAPFVVAEELAVDEDVPMVARG